MEDNMTSKQRAYLKSLAMKIDPIYNIGKGSISPELVQGVRDALESRSVFFKTVWTIQKNWQMFLQREQDPRLYRLLVRRSYYIRNQRIIRELNCQKQGNNIGGQP